MFLKELKQWYTKPIYRLVAVSCSRWIYKVPYQGVYSANSFSWLSERDKTQIYFHV